MAILTVLMMSVISGVMSQASEPARCCQPVQWEARLPGVGGAVMPGERFPQPIDTYTAMTYDYPRRRIALTVAMRPVNASAQPRKVHTVFDYNTDRMFVVEDGKCTISTIGEKMQEPCVPASAKFLSTRKLGYGLMSMNINAWEVVENGQVFKRAYTADGCIPFAEDVYGIHNGARYHLAQVVEDFRPGVAEPKVLDLPALDTCVVSPGQGPIYGKRAIFT